MSEKKVICLDFDGVLAHYTEWDGKIGEPNPEGIKLAKMLKEAGYDIVIQSCRWHSNFEDSSNKSDEVIEWLMEHNVPFDRLEYGSKAFASIYVDDRAVHFPANKGPADIVFKEIKERMEKEE